MSQTPEERAHALANRLYKSSMREWGALITQAIRQAENDKLEEAAQLIMTDEAWEGDICLEEAGHAASLVNSLKHKDT